MSAFAQHQTSQFLGVSPRRQRSLRHAPHASGLSSTCAGFPARAQLRHCLLFNSLLPSDRSYDLPPDYNTRMLQYKLDPWACVHRRFDDVSEGCCWKLLLGCLHCRFRNPRVTSLDQQPNKACA
jgi:hypothetical protein